MLLLHFILSFYFPCSFFSYFLSFSFTCIVLLTNFDNLCPCSPSVPFFCSSFTSIVLIFLPCSPLVPSSGSFHLPLCFFVFLVPSRSPSSIEPCQSFFLVPLPFSFFSLISVPRSFLRSLRFLLGGSCRAMYIKKNMHSGFVPFSSRSRSGRVSVSFPFRSGRVPFSFPFRSGRVPFSFPFRSGRVPFSFPFRSLFVSFSSRTRALFVPDAFN